MSRVATQASLIVEDGRALIAAPQHAEPANYRVVAMTDFVPDDFAVPEELVCDGFVLRPLAAEHNAADHAAWMASIDHIHETPGFRGRRWPFPMTLEQNLRDVERHQQDFIERSGFTYTVLDRAGEVIGCVYIYPSDHPDFDASLRSWVSADHGHLDLRVWEAARTWVDTSWPFAEVDTADRAHSEGTGRDQPP